MCLVMHKNAFYSFSFDVDLLLPPLRVLLLSPAHICSPRRLNIDS